MKTKIAVVVHEDQKLLYFTSLTNLSNDPSEAILFTSGTEAVHWATENDLSLDNEWTLAEMSVSGYIQVSPVKVF